MKKVILFCFFVTVTVVCNAQLNFSPEQDFVYLYKSNFLAVFVEGEKYIASFTETTRSTQSVEIELGHSKESAIESLQQLYDWHKKAAEGESIVIKQERAVTVYKTGSMNLIVSYGNAEYCRQVYKKTVTALLGVISKGNRSDDELYASINVSHIKKAINNMK